MNKAVRPLIVAALSVLLFSGCAHGPSVAATVDGVVISERSVQQATDALVAAYGAEPAEARLFALNRSVQGHLAGLIAADNGIALTEADRAKVYAMQPQLADLAARPHGKAIADDLIDLTVVAESLGEDKLVAELGKHAVTVNPRYGTWDPKVGAAVGSGSLSVEAPQG